MGGFLDGGDAACDGGALTNDDEVVDDDVCGDGAGEGVALLGGGAIEGLGDADGDGGVRRNGDVTEGRRGGGGGGGGGSSCWRRWWRGGCGYLGGRRYGRVLARWTIGAALGFGAGLGVGSLLWRGWRRWRRRRDGCGSAWRCGSLHGEVVDYGLDAGDLCGVSGGEGTGGFAADGAGEGGDPVLNGGLDGLGAEGAIAGETALQCCGQTGVVGGTAGAELLQPAKLSDDGESADGSEERVWRRDERLAYHEIPFRASSETHCEHCKSLNRYPMRRLRRKFRVTRVCSFSLRMILSLSVRRGGSGKISACIRQT